MADKTAIVKYLEHSGKILASRGVMPVKLRQQKLRDFARVLYENRYALCEAVKEDLGRDHASTLMCELQPLLDIVRFMARKLPALARGRWVRDNMATFPSLTRVYPEPYGRALVISTWNYPLLLALEPVIGAYAAGNMVILKLALRSSYSSAIIRKLLNKCFSDEEVLVIGNELTLDEVLQYRYDHIFLTGNSETGKTVMRAAAANLTPVTLELGGKNPCIVNADANLKVAARRIVWGKFLNAGQSCAAPDHLWVHRSVKAQLLNLIARYIKKFYGEHPLDDNSYCKLPDQAAYDRVCKLISSGRLVCGGDRDPRRLAVEPTVIDQVDVNDENLAQEMFAPVLPVFDFSSEEELLLQLRRNEKPLALYCFGGSRKFRKVLQRATSSGALVFDDTLIHFANPAIPFGGVGKSGMGAYHGKLSFSTFSHYKPVMKKFVFPDFALRYPPYSKLLTKLLYFFTRF